MNACEYGSRACCHVQQSCDSIDGDVGTEGQQYSKKREKGITLGTILRAFQACVKCIFTKVTLKLSK